MQPPRRLAIKHGRKLTLQPWAPCPDFWKLQSQVLLLASDECQSVPTLERRADGWER